MTEHIGEWHPVTATDITPEGDTDIDLELEVTHLDSCPVETFGSGDGPFDSYTDFICDLGTEVSAAGYDGFDISEPGIYRARFAAWQTPANPINGGLEWDACVEVERLEDAEVAS